MDPHIELSARLAAAICLTGVVATLFTDIWGIARRVLLGVPAPDYGLVGRWFACMARGRFRHDAIAAAPKVRGERLVGWAGHYLIGIVFAALLAVVAGPDWFARPVLVPALLLGMVTVLAPFLLMQPGMGAGIAASRTRNPARARLHSFITHTVFGLGLYAGGWVARLLCPT